MFLRERAGRETAGRETSTEPVKKKEYYFHSQWITQYRAGGKQPNDHHALTLLRQGEILSRTPFGSYSGTLEAVSGQVLAWS